MHMHMHIHIHIGNQRRNKKKFLPPFLVSLTTNHNSWNQSIYFLVKSLYLKVEKISIIFKFGT